MFPAVGVIENGYLTHTCGSQPDLTSTSGKAKQQDRGLPRALCVCGGGWVMEMTAVLRLA